MREVIVEIEPGEQAEGDATSAEQVPCPICDSGWVCEVEDEPGKTFWGCGDCGNVWPTRDVLDREN